MGTNAQDDLSVGELRMHGIRPVVDLDHFPLDTGPDLDTTGWEVFRDGVCDDLHQNLIALSCLDLHFPEELN